MTKRMFIPAAIQFVAELGASLAAAGKYGSVQKGLLEQVGKHLEAAGKKVAKLEAETKKAQGISDVAKQGAAYRDKVFPAMTDLRSDIDALEAILPDTLWPVPTYSDLLFNL
jgi:glutamine synthetase